MCNDLLLKGLSLLAAAALLPAVTPIKANASDNLTDSGIDYFEEVGTIQNPGAGYTSTVWAKCAPDKTSVYSPKGSFVLFFIDIGQFSSGVNGEKDYDLDDTFFSAWRQTFENCRKNGCLAGVRFRYDAEGKDDPEPASFDKVLDHINQIEKSHIFEDFGDIIVLVESGFVGKWGEQHGGKYTSVEYKAKLLDALNEAIDNIPITVRTPDTAAEWMGIKRSQINDAELMEKARLSPDTDDDRILSTRFGMYNDGYMGSNSDLGTFADREYETQWLNRVAVDTYYGGEFSGNIEFAMKYDNYLPENAIPEMYKTHLSYINGNIFPLYKDMEYTEKYAVEGADNSAYYGESVFQFIRDHIGYRFILRDSKLSSDIAQGGTLNLRFNVENTGFANPVFHPNSSVILEKDGVYIRTDVDIDCHDWHSCETAENSIDLHIPDNIEDGKWNVYFKACGGDGAVYNAPENINLCSIRFANNDTWNSSLGANYLGSVNISASDSAGNDYYLHPADKEDKTVGSCRYFFSNVIPTVDGKISFADEWTDDMKLTENENGQSIYARADENYLYIMSRMPTGAKAPVYNIQLKNPHNNENYWMYYESGGFIYFNHEPRGNTECKWNDDIVEFRLPLENFALEPNDIISSLRVFLQDSGNEWKLMGDITAKDVKIEPIPTVYEKTDFSPTNIAGDANCDGRVDLADAVLIMQAIANPDRFGKNGSDEKRMTETGERNADVSGENDGLTAMDALTIQKYMLKLIDKL